MQTGAVPQLARHSTNSMLYFPSLLTEIGLCIPFSSRCRTMPAAAHAFSITR